MNSSYRRKSSSSSATGTTTTTTTSGGGGGANHNAKIDATRKRITQMEQEREERRRSMIQRKEARKKEQLKNLAAGNPGDVDFIGMVDAWRKRQQQQQQQQRQEAKTKKGKTLSSHATAAISISTGNICIAIRKRPMSEKERDKLDHDSVSCFPPQVTVHSAKFKVDGITKYLTHNSFQFDHAYGDDSSTEDIYIQTTLPLVDHVLSTHGRATVFCYGQTGSGKTFTMNGIQQILAYDLYTQLLDYQQQQNNDGDMETTVAFFELYGGFIQDLLHDRQRCKLLEDGKGEVNITGLQEVPADTPEDFLHVIDQGNSLRTTHTTEANDSSSRSHAICQVFLRQNGKLKGKLTLVDLAGSERGSDTRSHNTQRRAESADINTSLLSLKECIRSLGQKSAHVPYRGSKLTLILKDCFSTNSKTTMIATVSPGASSTDHSLNTLRYADRIKEQRTTTTTTNASKRRSTAGGKKKSPSQGRPPPPPPTQKRLELIANANALARERRQEASQDALAQEYKTLSPTGLVESLEESSDRFYSETDNDDDLLFTDNANASSSKHQNVIEELMEEADEEENENEDDEYVPSEDEEEDDDDHFYTPTASEEADEDRWDDAQHLEDDVDGKQTEDNPSSAAATSMDDEEEMRRIVQGLFELEESLLNQHMTNIQQHAEMLTQEGKLLQTINPEYVSEVELDDYAIQLAEYLDRKEIMIYKLQHKLGEFQQQLAKEQEMSQRVQKLSQY